MSSWGSGDFKNRNKWYFLVLDNFPTNGRGIQASPLKPCRRIGAQKVLPMHFPRGKGQNGVEGVSCLCGSKKAPKLCPVYG